MHRQGSLSSNFFFFFFNILSIYLTVLGLRCCIDFSSVVASRGSSPGAERRLLTVVASPVSEHGL